MADFFRVLTGTYFRSCPIVKNAGLVLWHSHRCGYMPPPPQKKRKAVKLKQKVLVLGNTIEDNKLRDKVIHVLKQVKCKYFESQVNHLKTTKP